MEAFALSAQRSVADVVSPVSQLAWAPKVATVAVAETGRLNVQAGFGAVVLGTLAGMTSAGNRRYRHSGAAQQKAVAMRAQVIEQATLNKLADALKVAVDAEANADEAVTVARFEDNAREMVLFAKNGFSQFGSGTQAEKRPYSDQEMKDNDVNAENLLSLEDTTVGLRRGFLAAFSFGGGSFILAFKPTVATSVVLIFAFLTFWGVDLLVSQGLVQNLVVDTLARVVNSEYQNRVVQSEAARFLVGYLLGVLPKAYTLSTIDCLSRFQSTAIKPGTVFCQTSFQRELEAGTLSGKSVDKFVCVKLAGIVQEYLMFKGAQSGAANLESVEGLFEALKFDPRRSNDETRYAIINIVGLLKKHKEAHTALAKAMARGSSVGECIAIIERNPPPESVVSDTVSQVGTA